MKNLRRDFERLCFKNRNKGIPNLMLYICVGAAVVYFLSMVNGGNVVYDLLCFDKAKILKGQVWRLFSYVLTLELGSSPLWVVIGLYCTYMLGRAVENSWGTFKFNLFYLVGILLMDVFALIFCPMETVIYTVDGLSYEVPQEAFHYFYSGNIAYYLDLALLISFATLYPDAQFRIFFIIPIKAWVLGLLYLVLNAIEVINLCIPVFMFPHCFFPLVGFANYLLFFGKDVANLIPVTWRIRFKRITRKKSSPKVKTGTTPFRTPAPEKKVVTFTHCCTVCGRNDTENPDLEFRYCSRCRGYHCYCQDHISNHEHVQ